MKVHSKRMRKMSKLHSFRVCFFPGFYPEDFSNSHPRQWKLISRMLQLTPGDRPSATEILASCDLLPPRLEDDFLNEALRVVSAPSSGVFTRVVESLFSAGRVRAKLLTARSAIRLQVSKQNCNSNLGNFFTKIRGGGFRLPMDQMDCDFLRSASARLLCLEKGQGEKKIHSKRVEKM